MVRTEKGYVFPAALSHLRDMLDLVRSAAREAEFENSEISKIELAVEEALANIICYAYPDSPQGTVEITCSVLSRRALRVRLRDQGIPYNPLESPPCVDPTSSLEERPVGGLGLFLMSQIMDEVHYERDGGSNVLTLHKGMSYPPPLELEP